MFTFLEALFALGTIPFWILLFIDFVVVTALVENEEGVWATIVAVGSLIGLNYLWKLPILATIKANPLRAAELIGAYFVLGIAWSGFKWVLNVHKEIFKYNDFKAQFLQKNNAAALTPELSVKLQEALDEINAHNYTDELKISQTPPQFRDNKATLTRWATYWPFSMVGFALNDVVRKSWTYLVNLFQNVYQRISNYIYRDAIADKAMATEYKAKQAAAGANGGTSDVPRNRRGN